MLKNIIICCLLTFSFSAYSAKRYFLLKGQELYLMDGKDRRFITRNVTMICFPYLLKGKDLYYMVKDDFARVLRVTTKIDGLYAGKFLKGGKLYLLKEDKFDFVTSGVTRVYDACPPQEYPETYLPQN